MHACFALLFGVAPCRSLLLTATDLSCTLPLATAPSSCLPAARPELSLCLLSEVVYDSDADFLQYTALLLHSALLVQVGAHITAGSVS